MRHLTAHRFLLTAWLVGRGMVTLGNAYPVLGNLAQPSVDHLVPVTLHEWQATSFRLSETAEAWRVRSVTVRMAQQIPNESFALWITGEASLRPALNDVRVALTTPTITGTATQTVTFTAKTSPPPILQPGQTYWLVAAVERADGNFTPATGLLYWSYASTSQIDAAPVGGWSFGPNTASAGTLGANWTPEATTPFSFSIDAVPDDPVMTLTRWRQWHPGGPNDDATFLNTDSDGNGLTGLMEFACDATPANLPQPIANARGIEYIRWTNCPELTLSLQISPNLTSWTTPLPADLITTTTEAGPFTTRVHTRLRSSNGNTFLRLHISRP